MERTNNRATIARNSETGKGYFIQSGKNYQWETVKNGSTEIFFFRVGSLWQVTATNSRTERKITYQYKGVYSDKYVKENRAEIIARVTRKADEQPKQSALYIRIFDTIVSLCRFDMATVPLLTRSIYKHDTIKKLLNDDFFAVMGSLCDLMLDARFDSFRFCKKLKGFAMLALMKSNANARDNWRIFESFCDSYYNRSKSTKFRALSLDNLTTINREQLAVLSHEHAIEGGLSAIHNAQLDALAWYVHHIGDDARYFRAKLDTQTPEGKRLSKELKARFTTALNACDIKAEKLTAKNYRDLCALSYAHYYIA